MSPDYKLISSILAITFLGIVFNPIIWPQNKYPGDIIKWFSVIIGSDFLIHEGGMITVDVYFDIILQVFAEN